ncbi:OmpA family protein [Microscilla marina]|nr:OmpA family protein [Microscilla marina]
MLNFKHYYLFLWLCIFVLMAQACTPPPTVERFRGRRFVNYGDEVTLSWNVPKATSVEIEGVQNNLPAKGKIKIKPGQTTTYKLIARNKKHTVTKEYKVKVVKRSAVIDKFDGDDEIAEGEEANLYWSVRDAKTIRIAGLDKTLKANESLTIKPDSTTQYILEAKDRYGEVVRDTHTVKVKFDEYFKGPRSISVGEKVRVKWRFKQARFVVFQNDTLPTEGTTLLQPKRSKNYSMMVIRNNRKVNFVKLPIKVVPVTFKGKKDILLGSKTLIRWNAKGMKSVIYRGDSLPLVGSMEVAPLRNTTYKFLIDDGEKSFVKSFRVRVIRRKFIKNVAKKTTLKKGQKLDFDIFATDRSKFPKEVKLYVLVTDTSGNFISHLAPPYVSYRESRKFFRKIVESVKGRRYAINNFKVREIHEMISKPYDISLVMDYSGSMAGNIKKLEEATRKFILTKHPNDKISVVKFDERLETELRLTAQGSKTDCVKFDGLTRYGGSTALYAGADEGLESLKNAQNNKVMLLFTDGEENSSLQYFGKRAFRASEVVKKAREKGIRVFTIAYGTGVNNKTLNALSMLTDGKTYFIENPDEIKQVYEELPRIFRNFYEITYRPVNVQGQHDIELTYNNGLGKSQTVGSSTHIGENYEIDKYDYEGAYKYQTNLKKRPVAPPQSVAFFEYNKYELKDKFIKNLEPFIKYLQKNKNAELAIYGHTDQVGTAAACLLLSQRRANAIKQYFVRHGVAAKRITAKGYGKAKPIWKNEKHDWQAKENRRIELLLLE